jgi:uncharacterized OsmC-like protein
MITAKVLLTQPFKAERQFAATTGSEHHMLLDDAAGGTGPKPVELVAVGLAGCTAFDVEEKTQWLTPTPANCTRVKIVHENARTTGR